MNRTLVAIALLGILPAPAAESQDARQWAEALAYYQRCSVSKDSIERKQAAEKLGEATSEKHDKVCWQLVLALLRAELAKEGQSGKSEEKVSGDVIDGCINAFRKISGKDGLAEMMKLAKAKAENPRIRAVAIWGLMDRGDLKNSPTCSRTRVRSSRSRSWTAWPTGRTPRPLPCSFACSPRTAPGR